MWQPDLAQLEKTVKAADDIAEFVREIDLARFEEQKLLR